MEEKQEFVFKGLRELTLALNKMLSDPNKFLGAPVYMTIFPDGEIYIE